MIKKVAPVLLVFLFAGCYTQFAYVRPNVSGETPSDSVGAADSVYAGVPQTYPPIRAKFAIGPET